MARLTTNFVGLKLKSPLIVASSGLTETVERMEKAERSGAGAVVMKSLFEEEVSRKSPAPRFRVIRHPGGGKDALTFYSYEQASSWGLERYAKEVKEAKKKLSLKIIPSINCISEKGWHDYARLLEGAGADALELNTSCPHGSITFRGTEVEETILRTCELVRKSVMIPLIAKISPMLTSPLSLAKKLEAVGIDGITIFNRLTGLEIDTDKEMPVMHRGYAGHGGPWAIHYSLRWISQIRGEVKIDIAGSGGVTSGEDIIKYLLVGANAVQVATLIYLEGFPIISRINADLTQWMEKRHYQKIDDFRGRALPRLRGEYEIDRRFLRIARIDQRPTAPCKTSCPVGVPNQAFIAALLEGDLKGAYSLIKSCDPFQEVLGRVCPALCEEGCVRSLIDKPLNLRQLKRQILDEGRKKIKYTPAKAASCGKKVAVVGGGPAGLTCAYDLARAGYRVSVFEKEDKPGGMLRFGIPAYRLPRSIIDREIKNIKKLGVRIKLKSNITNPPSLLRQGFSALFLGTGAALPVELKIAGASDALDAIEFLKKVNSGRRPRIGKKVAVIGGGNTALDSARLALRLGAREVYLVYRRTRREMPAISTEVDAAEEEGVKILYLVLPRRIVKEKGKIAGLECLNLTLGKEDKSGRRSPDVLEGTQFLLAVDTVISALGQRPSPPPGIKARGIFAGGDLLKPATVVEAVASGRKAARAIDEYLRGKAAVLISPAEMKKVDAREVISRHPEVRVEERMEASVISPARRRKSFAEVEENLTPEKARVEAGRCLACGCGSGCGFCDRACIYSALKLSGDKFEVDPEICEGCGLCVEVCPRRTIEMVRRK